MTSPFDRVTGVLATFLNDDSQTYTLPTDALAGEDALAAVIELLAGEALALTGATIARRAGAPATWTVSGSPAAAWPIPGLQDALSAAGASASLTVTDRGAADPDYDVTLAGATRVGASPLNLTLAFGSGTPPTIGLSLRAEGGLPLSGLVAALALPGLNDALTRIGDLLRVLDAALVTAEITLQPGGKGSGKGSGKGQSPAVEGGSLVGTLLLGDRAALQLTVDFTAANVAEPTIAIVWPAPGHAASGTLNDLLSGIGTPFALPPPLDIAFGSLSLSYDAVAEGDRLNPNDTHRLVLASPGDSAAPDVLATWSFDANGRRRTTMRADWHGVSLDALPIVGSHLPARLRPLILLLVGDDIAVAELAALARLTDCPGLETLGLAEGATVPAGIQCASVFDVTVDGAALVRRPILLPLYEAQAAPAVAAAQAGGAVVLSENNRTASASVQRSVGPVHIAGVGLRFENGAISVLLDLGITAGGLAIELVGLSVAFGIADRSLSIGIEGLLIAFESGGVGIEGALVRTGGAGSDWGGTALVKVGDTFALQALGAFADGDRKSLFLFAYDHQQLGGPPWFVITGIAAGFGYNRAFVVPAVDHVDDFPFVRIADGLARGEAPNGGEPLDIQALWALMAGIETYLGPADGTNFLTVGITGTSFGLVNTTALMTIEFGASVAFVILGSSSISIPAEGSIAHAEVEIVASVQPEMGLLAIDGLLAPGSYILSGDCHLTGGFAYHIWFSGPHADDFVLSFGGYGPTYHLPPHYPAVPRLAFTWKVSDDVLITGWNYFALTPSSVQAGGGLSIVLDAGPLSVWCDVQADFFLQWMPFFYDLHFSVDFGVSFRLDLLFCSVTISVDVAADLEIWGPDFSGHAEVSLWFVSFGLGFGAGAPHEPAAVHWDGFVASLVVPDANPAASVSAARRPAHQVSDAASAELTQQPVQIVAVAGITDAPAGSGADWIADPARTVLSVATTMPAAKAHLNGAALAGSDGTVPSLTIEAVPLEGTPTIDPCLDVTVASDEAVTAWVGRAQVGQVPSALWSTSTASELVPGLTGARLSITPAVPDRTAWIDRSVIETDTRAAIPVAWQKADIPAQGAFDWAADNPLRTATKDLIAARLGPLVAAGDIDRAAVDAIDLDLFLQPAQPSFMVQPILARLGSDPSAGHAP